MGPPNGASPWFPFIAMRILIHTARSACNAHAPCFPGSIREESSLTLARISYSSAWSFCSLASKAYLCLVAVSRLYVTTTVRSAFVGIPCTSLRGSKGTMACSRRREPESADTETWRTSSLWST